MREADKEEVAYVHVGEVFMGSENINGKKS